MTQLNIEETKRSRTRRPRTPNKKGGKQTASKSTAKKSSKEKTSLVEPKPPLVDAECVALLKRKGDIMRLMANCLATREDPSSSTLLSQAGKFPMGNQQIIFHGLTEARILFQEAFSLISSDPIFSVLQESSRYSLSYR
jgi:separase